MKADQSVKPMKAAMRQEGRLLLGTALAELSRNHGVTNADVDALEKAIEDARDKRPAEPIRFE